MSQTKLFGVQVWIDKGKVLTSKLFALVKHEGAYVNAKTGNELAGPVVEKPIESQLFMEKVTDTFTYIGSEDDCRHFRNGVKIGRKAQHTAAMDRLSKSFGNMN